MPGCKGHVIIDSNEYSFYSRAKGTPALTTEKVDFSKGNSDAILTPSIDHVLLGQKLSSDSALASTTKQIEVADNMVAIIYTDSPGYVRAIQEVPIGLFHHSEKAADYIRGRSREFGARRAFVASEIQGNSFANIRKLVKQGVLHDAVLIKENGWVRKISLMTSTEIIYGK